MECFISGNQRVCESLSERNKCAPCPVSGVCPYVAHVPSSGRRSPSVPMAIPQRSPRNGGWLLPAATPFVFRPILLFFLFLLLATTFVCAKSTAHRPPYTTKAVSASQTNLSPPDVAISRTARHDHDHADSEISHVDDDDEGADDSDSTVPDTATDSTIQDVVVEPDNREETDSEEKSAESSSSSGETVPSIDVTEEEVVEDENDFCRDNYVDSAYFNGYDTILTRGDQLWYYYKEQHKLSKAFDQRRFTQGEPNGRCQIGSRARPISTH